MSHCPLPQGDNSKQEVSRSDRLIQLVLKGVLYESCVEYCQQAATGADSATITYVSLLQDTGFSEADLSLLAWLQSIPYDTFGCPFEQKVRFCMVETGTVEEINVCVCVCVCILIMCVQVSE